MLPPARRDRLGHGDLANELVQEELIQHLLVAQVRILRRRPGIKRLHDSPRRALRGEQSQSRVNNALLAQRPAVRRGRMPPERVEIAIGYLRVGAPPAIVLVFHRLQSPLCPGRIPLGGTQDRGESIPEAARGSGDGCPAGASVCLGRRALDLPASTNRVLG
jgi:hypothetical protein